MHTPRDPTGRGPPVPSRGTESDLLSAGLSRSRSG